ncbi:hypothetical protein, partial [Halorubrum lacusprofundi]|uniref:hypothetical protein n=1 Tax=Halorubrum lacusprofundi TaxID=2247 RepID=UPI00197A977D
KFLVEAVDDKIKQVLFLYLAVCLGRLHTAPKQTLTLTRCDRLKIVCMNLVRYGYISSARC